MKIRLLCAQAAFALAAVYANTSGAAPILCQDPANNHMNIDDAYVSSCLGAGEGNINGNTSGGPQGNDDFLTGEGSGLGLVHIETGYSATQSGDTGTFTLDASLWDAYSSLAFGFKFGTGGQPDEWFVFELNPFVTTGTWEFVNMGDRGGGLSHIEMYGIPSRTVPEPGTLALLGLGMLGLSLARRRQSA